VLVVDDDPQIQKMIGLLLNPDGFKIIQSTSGHEAVRLCVSTKPDLVLLALSLPDMDGKDVIRAIREWSVVPIIIVSARSSDAEVVEALNLGANDYVVKPFNLEVLLARINAALRTSATREAGEAELSNGPLRMDLVGHRVFLNDKLLALTPKEYDLLRHFMINRGKMLTHREILKTVWGEAHGDNVTYLRVYIGQLRGKIENDLATQGCITTEPGVGYRMESLPF